MDRRVEVLAREVVEILYEDPFSKIFSLPPDAPPEIKNKFLEQAKIGNNYYREVMAELYIEYLTEEELLHLHEFLQSKAGRSIARKKTIIFKKFNEKFNGFKPRNI